MKSKQYSIEFQGKTLIAEFSDLALRASGSVMMRYDNTVILVTAVMGKIQEDVDFFPLTVDYEERFYASGKISGSRFIKREGRPSDEAILSGRIVDRTIRPLFDHHIRNEIQVVVTILSIDESHPHTLPVIAVIGASLAIGTSNIPWNGPVSAIRQVKEGFDLVACGKNGLINMIEMQGNEISEKEINDSLHKSSQEIEKIQTWQEEIIKEIVKEKAVEKTVIEKPALVTGTKEFIDEEMSELLHREVIDNDKRPDGRKMDEIRPIFVKAGGISPVLHGSGTFYRGDTHILSVLTLGGPSDAQIIDGMEATEVKRFMHHYNFPPFSTGETGRIGGTNRRMIGHGALAEKALSAVIPPVETFPYTIRIVSEAFSSNGSTSMGSVCGSTLALMDAGVPIKAPVAGISCGLMMRERKAKFIEKMVDGLSGTKRYEYKILTDIQGPEDYYGDMDFKIAGTRNGIVAIQMDIKISGIPLKILEETLERARVARLQILDLIGKEIDKPRSDISSKAPKILTIKIKQDQIGLIIGPGGKTIKEIKEKTGVEDISIEEDGTIFIVGKNGSAEKAKAVISNMTTNFIKQK